MDDDFSAQSYDLAAEKAEQELSSLISKLDKDGFEVAMSIFQWQERNFYTAGHKRLGRILVKFSKKKFDGNRFKIISQKDKDS